MHVVLRMQHASSFHETVLHHAHDILGHRLHTGLVIVFSESASRFLRTIRSLLMMRMMGTIPGPAVQQGTRVFNKLEGPSTKHSRPGHYF